MSNLPYQGKDKLKTEEEDITIVKKKITPKQIEIWEVAMLSCNIEPVSRPSIVLENLEERRKSRHEEALNKLVQGMNQVNSNTEKNIQISSVEVKAHMNYFNDQMKQMLSTLDKPEVLSYSSTVFFDQQNKGNKFKIKLQELVDELLIDLNKYEDERAEANKKLFHVAGENIRKIGYILPYEVQTFIENEILKLNHMSLSNRRCYEDLHLTLTLLTQQMFKSFIDKIGCIHSKWSQKKALDFYIVGAPKTAERRNIRPQFYENYFRCEIKGLELNSSRSENEIFCFCNINDHYKNVEDTLRIIEDHTNLLQEFYKKVLNAVYNGLDQDLEDIRKECGDFRALIIEEREMMPLRFEGSIDKVRHAGNLENYWQENLFEMKPQFKDLTDFLFHLITLRQRHSARICDSKKLILRAVERTEDINQDVLTELETKLNFALDLLRQEHNKSKLESEYIDAISILETIKKKHEMNYVDTVLIIEDFYKMMVLEADVLSAEIKEFIYLTHYVDNTKADHRYSDYYNPIPETSPIFKEIQLCNQKLKAIGYWKQGLWTALETLSNKTREFLKVRAENWISRKIDFFAEKVTFQIELLNKREERIREQIYKRREFEIEFHNDVYQQHKAAVTEIIEQKVQKLENLMRDVEEELNGVKDIFEVIESNAMVENRVGVIHSSQIMLDRKKQELEGKIKLLFEKFKVACDTKMNDLTQANINFMKDIKLFHEDGNYNIEEAKMYIQLLESIDRKITVEFKKIITESTEEEKSFIQKNIDTFAPTIQMMNYLYDEVYFHSMVKERLMEFTNYIHGLVVSFREDFNLLQEHMDCFTRKSKNDKLSNESHFKLWQILMELLYKNVSNLFYPITLLVTNDFDEFQGEGSENFGEVDTCACRCQEMSKLLARTKLSKVPSKKIASGKINFDHKDFRSELFNGKKTPQNNGTFMAVISNAFWDEMTDLQLTASNFYKKIQGREILRNDLISSSYNEFIQKILSKFQFYYMQIEQFWLQIILDFLPLLGRIKQTINEYTEQKLADYQELASKALYKLGENFKACIEYHTCDRCKKLNDLDDKLLPLHGNPNNEKLLSMLEEEVVHQTAEMKVKFEAAVTLFKDQLKCFRIRHLKEKKEIKKIELQYIENKEKLFSEDLGSNILSLLQEYCERGGYLYQNALLSDIPEDYQLKFFNITLLSLPNYYMTLRDLIQAERLQVTPDALISPYKEPVDVLLKPIDLGAATADCQKQLNKFLASLRDFADAQIKSYEDGLFEWLELWKFNVKSVMKLFMVKYDEKPGFEENKLNLMNGMADLESNKPKSEKTSASVSSTLPRLCPTTKTVSREFICNIPKLKNRQQKSRAVSNESKRRPGPLGTPKKNLQKSKLTESKNSEQGLEGIRELSSPRTYHGQIPVLIRRSLHSIGMSPSVTRSSSPLKKKFPKELKSPKIKTITLDDEKKKSKTSSSRSSSPIKKNPVGYRSSKCKTISPRLMDKTTSKQAIVKQSPRTKISAKKNSKAKVFSSSNVDFAVKESNKKHAHNRNLDSIILKQTSQPSLSKNEKLVQPQEKISLDHLKNKVYSGDHKRTSYEKVHVCIEKSIENLAGESKSYRVTYSTEEVQKEEIPIGFLQNLSRTSLVTYSTEGERKTTDDTIRTLSGHELVLTPSMKLDIEKSDVGEDIEISELLNESGQFEEFKDAQVHEFQDDANEYDSEVSTDGEVSKERFKSPKHSAVRMTSRSGDLHRRSASSLWKTREVDLFNDVDYRQSVYHPTVSRRVKEEPELEFRPKCKSIEDNFGSWATSFDKNDGKPIYNSVLENGSFYGAKRTRSKKERVAGGLLRITLKVIRLLAIFNLWPGDNCHMMTSQTLRLSR